MKSLWVFGRRSNNWTAARILFMAGDYTRNPLDNGAAPTLREMLEGLRQYLARALSAESVAFGPAMRARALSRRDSIRVYLRAALMLIADYGYSLDRHVQNHIRPIAELVSGKSISEDVIRKARQSLGDDSKK